MAVRSERRAELTPARYFALPPRFQFLHSLRNRVIGGASYFVDSFAAAKALEREQPALYASLQRNVLEYEYDNDDHYMTFRHPVLPAMALDAPDLHAVINWSPPFQAPNVRATADSTGTIPADPAARAAAEREFYAALDAFQEALDRPEFRYEFTLQEGDVVLFDNQRVLHARTAFRDKTPEEIERDGTVIVPGEPTRWLKGCYLDGSTVWDKLAVLNDKVRGIPSQ
jgi:alpha-ketoglutarate-dependent taurine dioxygenase